jgi:AcrR family transcriptional regulator
MARPPATEEQRERQRGRIRAAAVEIYRETGIAGVSIRAVAARAGVSQGTIYSYFTNRATLLRSLWIEPVGRAGRELEELAATIVDPVERLRAILEHYVEFALGNPDVHRGAMLYVRPSSYPQPDPLPIDELTLFRLLAETLQELDAAGRLDADDPRLTAELMWAAVHGALGLAINSDVFAVTPAAQLAPPMIDLIIGAVLTDD